MIQVRVEILPKPEILDPQGRAVLEVLRALPLGAEPSTKALSEVKVGKVVHLFFEASLGKEKALELARAYSESVLANPLIESFALEVIH
jgi:phosphoribosylformylglycinamidine synthase